MFLVVFPKLLFVWRLTPRWFRTQKLHCCRDKSGDQNNEEPKRGRDWLQAPWHSFIVIDSVLPVHLSTYHCITAQGPTEQLCHSKNLPVVRRSLDSFFLCCAERQAALLKLETGTDRLVLPLPVKLWSWFLCDLFLSSATVDPKCLKSV